MTPEQISAVSARIVALYAIQQDKFDDRRHQAQWEPLISNANARYSELKRHLSFSEASRITMEEAVATIIREAAA